MTDTTKPKLKGFAALLARDPDRMSQIAALGGSSVPAHKRGFAVDRELAKSAGRTGGLVRSSAKGGPKKKGVES